jgi:peptidoglycan/LPS O-acetylase OafA/YrhL
MTSSKYNWLDRFRRVTSSTSYLPEIDGLRFLAVFWVAIIMHTTNYLDDKFYNGQLVGNGYWRGAMLEGTHGMYLFFMISGFILSLPFAKAALVNAPKIDLRRYYIRRLTRLEPPYIIALIIFFIAHVFILNKYTLVQLLPSFFASLFYSHTLIYQEHPLIMPVAWSLEVEVQFYILAPLLCSIFLLKQVWVRRLLFLLVIFGGAAYPFYVSRDINLLRFIHYFFAGILLADLYVSKAGKTNYSAQGFWAGVIALVMLLVFPSRYVFSTLLIKQVVLFIVFYQALFNERFKQLFTVKWMTIIGGMCYSIYLLHFGIIACFGAIVLKFTNDFSIYQAPIYLLIITALILLLSAAYFYFIEKPFMQYNSKRLKQPGK